MTNQAPPPTDRQIAALRAPCTDEERATFATFYAHVLADELARADAAAPNTIDPDTVERAFIDELLARVRGEAGDLCVVPLPTPAGEDWRVYRFSPSAALPVPVSPTDTPDVGAVPRTAAPPPSKRWALLAIVGGCLALLALFWPRSVAPDARAAQDATATSTAVAANVTPLPSAPLRDAQARGVTTDDPTTLELAGDVRQVWRVVPSRSELGGVWTPDLQAGQAAWLADSVVNPILCVPPTDDGTLAELERGTPFVLRLASGAVRQYEVLHVERVGRQQTEVLEQRTARLTLIACGTAGDERTVVQALYRPAIDGLPPLPDVRQAEIPQWVEIDEVRSTLDGATGVITISAAITNRSGHVLPLTDLVDQLLVDGVAVPVELQRRREPLTVNERRFVTWQYRAPAGVDGQAVWQLVTPDGQRADVLVMLNKGEE